MLRKLGLLLLVVLFGACMFVAGVAAPDAWRTSISARLPFGAVSAPASAASVVAAEQSIAAPATAATSPSKAASTPPKMDSLLVSTQVQPPTAAAGKPAFALQLGQYASAAAATTAAADYQRSGLRYALVRLQVADSGGATWTVLAIGRFPSAELAAHAEPQVRGTLKLSRVLRVIRLPPAKPAGASAKTAS